MVQPNLSISDLKVTKERFLEWAQEQVAKQPTYRHFTGCDRECKPIYDVLPNSVERELCNLFGRWQWRNYQAYTHSDLLMAIRDFCQDGLKGYKQMALTELLDEIEFDIVDTLVEDGVAWEQLQREVPELLDTSGD